jgi:hypothetical protein
MGNDPPTRGDGSQSKAIPLQGWKIHFDTPPAPASSRQAEGGDILALFCAWNKVRVNDPDRRCDSRYIPAESQIWVGWWNGPRFVVIQAKLVNLSKGGALVNLGSRPPTSQPVWICLGNPHPVDHVQARVLDTSGHRDTEFHARLEFHAPCPPSFFLAAGTRVERPPTDTR